MTKARLTALADLCPICDRRHIHAPKQCDECGWTYGRDWTTVLVDLETNVIVRTVVPARPYEVKP